MKRINNVIKSFVVTCCLFLLFACEKKINIQIVDYIERNHDLCDKKDSCSIDIRTILNLHWDTMYVFPSWTQPEDISAELRIKYKGDYVKDDNRRIILTKNHIIVREEDYSVWGKYGIEFVNTNWPNQIIKISTSKFIVTKKRRDNKDFVYKLKPAPTRL